MANVHDRNAQESGSSLKTVVCRLFRLLLEACTVLHLLQITRFGQLVSMMRVRWVALQVMSQTLIARQMLYHATFPRSSLSIQRGRQPPPVTGAFTQTTKATCWQAMSPWTFMLFELSSRHVCVSCSVKDLGRCRCSLDRRLYMGQGRCAIIAWACGASGCR